jgi:hypothetical protein
MFGQKPTGLARKTSLALRADSELGYDNRVWRSAALNGGPDPLSLWGSGSSTVPITLCNVSRIPRLHGFALDTRYLSLSERTQHMRVTSFYIWHFWLFPLPGHTQASVEHSAACLPCARKPKRSKAHACSVTQGRSDTAVCCTKAHSNDRRPPQHGRVRIERAREREAEGNRMNWRGFGVSLAILPDRGKAAGANYMAKPGQYSQAPPPSYVTRCRYQSPVRSAMYRVRQCTVLYVVPSAHSITYCRHRTVHTVQRQICRLRFRITMARASPIGEDRGNRSAAMTFCVHGSPFWWDTWA